MSTSTIPDDPRTDAEIAADLTRLLEADAAIERLQFQLDELTARRKTVRDDLKDAIESRNSLSHEIRFPLPLFGGGDEA